jgi:hypothetical protein
MNNGAPTTGTDKLFSKILGSISSSSLKNLPANL